MLNVVVLLLRVVPVNTLPFWSLSTPLPVMNVSVLVFASCGLPNTSTTACLFVMLCVVMPFLVNCTFVLGLGVASSIPK